MDTDTFRFIGLRFRPVFSRSITEGLFYSNPLQFSKLQCIFVLLIVYAHACQKMQHFLAGF